MSQNLYNLRQYDFISFYRQFPDEIRHFSKFRNCPVRISDYVGPLVSRRPKVKILYIWETLPQALQNIQRIIEQRKVEIEMLEIVVGMLNFSLMMEYFIPLASTLK